MIFIYSNSKILHSNTNSALHPLFIVRMVDNRGNTAERQTLTVGGAGGFGSDLTGRLQFSIFFSYAVISCLLVLSSFKSSSKLSRETQRTTIHNILITVHVFIPSVEQTLIHSCHFLFIINYYLPAYLAAHNFNIF